MFTSVYDKSCALIIGINNYQHASPLGYAVSDAQAIADLLAGSLGFEAGNIKVLLNGEATKTAILQAFFSFSGAGSDLNDRVVVFFAGHGHTILSHRGEVGFLVPHDGRADDPSTLIRWDELSRGADLITAKHMLFIMDACYGGLAITRTASPGSMRFLDDMMRRFSRQVLTAGKADETVADLGGPLPNHSVFTGHLLEALGGRAKDASGNLTANSVIAYVYQAVSSDPSSNQTPHYGYFHGDGDMIFAPKPEQLERVDGVESEAHDLVSIPAAFDGERQVEMAGVSELKELLSDSRKKIQLRDYINHEVRRAIAKTGDDFLSMQVNVDKEVVVNRLLAYEAAMKELAASEILLGFWGEAEHARAAQTPFRRLSDRLYMQAGSTHLLNLRWYPLLYLMYCHGLGAVAAENYTTLKLVFETPVPEPNSGSETVLVMGVTTPLTESYDLFKWTPDGEGKKTARSEHLFKSLQPLVEDLLFLGREYERVFDRFEMLYCLEYACRDEGSYGRVWGPIGRFGWRGRYQSIFSNLQKEIVNEGPSWPPLRAGLFSGDYAKVAKTAEALGKTIAEVSWHL